MGLGWLGQPGLWFQSGHVVSWATAPSRRGVLASTRDYRSLHLGSSVTY